MNFIQHNTRLLLSRISPPDKSIEPVVWTWRHDSGKPNFGDELFLRIVEAKLGRNALSESDNRHRRSLYPGGSVLHRCIEGDVLWGVGLNNPKFHFRKLFPRDVDIRGVRGPVTAAFIRHSLNRDMPTVIGDPALLVSRLFPLDAPPVKQHEAGIINHFNSPVQNDQLENIRVIDPLRKSAEVIRDIVSCKFIISSSLHGIIVAESYGIPARWLRSPKVPDFKFYDYYLSTDRVPEPCDSVEDAMLKGGQQGIGSFDYEKLESSFPFDCFDRANASRHSL